MCPAPKAASKNQHPEEGSGTVLALTIIAALLVLTVVIAGLIGVVSANRRASAAADLSALAAADAYRGLTEGDPCAVAAELAERHGAHLESCTFPDRPETVEVTVAVPVAGPMGMLGPARGRARAGAALVQEGFNLGQEVSVVAGEDNVTRAKLRNRVHRALQADVDDLHVGGTRQGNHLIVHGGQCLNEAHRQEA